MAKSQYEKICDRLLRIEQAEVEILQDVAGIKATLKERKKSNGNKPLLIAVSTIVLSQLLIRILPELLSFVSEAAQ